MQFIVYPLKYIGLRGGDGWLVVWRDLFWCTFSTIVIVTIFRCVDGANFFFKDGFVDKIGSITSSLTGFYIAGLLAVATFSIPKADLDNVIKDGPVYLSSDKDRVDPLTRREYVCLMFGYLSMLALIISIISALEVGASLGIANMASAYVISLFGKSISALSAMAIVGSFIFALITSHLLITTGYGLYYLTSRIYDREPELIQPPKEPRVR